MNAAPNPLHTRLVAALIGRLGSEHRGRARGISAQRLAALMAIPERLLRDLISQAREQGIAIVGVPASGYYIAETAAELDQCCRFLRSRAMHSLRLEAQMRRISLPDLLGQLHLNT